MPGFAQTNTGADRYRTHSAANVARVYVPARGLATDTAELPPNIAVSSLYRPLIARMLELSPTFRQQCARLGRARQLTIDLRSEPPRRANFAAAWTNIRRSGGGIEATVTVPATVRRAELIAHEFEHILEYLDGVNLAELSRVASSGVRNCECLDTETYETARAVRAGLRVADEVGEVTR